MVVTIEVSTTLIPTETETEVDSSPPKEPTLDKELGGEVELPVQPVPSKADDAPLTQLASPVVLNLGEITEFERETDNLLQVISDRDTAQAVFQTIVENASPKLLEEAVFFRHEADSAGGVAFDANYLWKDIDALSDAQKSLFEDLDVAIGAISALGTAGYILWSLRGGVLVAAALSQMPNWRLIDPLPVLDSYAGNKESAQDDDMKQFFDN